MTAPRRARAILEGLFRAALEAVEPAAALRRAVKRDRGGLCIAGEPVGPASRLFVLAAGKAAAVMAQALEAEAGAALAAGLAVAPDDHGAPLERVDLRFASHPVPDARGEWAAREAIALVEGTRRDDVLVVLLSGGASSLLSCPAAGLHLDDLAATTAALLASGAEIAELNAVRKHLSQVAGGRLARRATCARVEVLAISDVPEDRLDVLGSGPLAADPTTYADALEVVERLGVRPRLPRAVLEHLAAGARGELEETPKPGDPAVARVRTTLLASNRSALEGACAAAAARGLRVFALPGALHGEARVAGRRLASLARALRSAEPVCVVVGGETAVTVRGRGRGGRSQELALAAALGLDGGTRAALLAAGTDGTDGPTDAAGAYVDGGTVSRARCHGVDALAALQDNDSYSFFSAEGGLFRTGPTRTNVMDLVLLLVDPVRQPGPGSDAP